MTLRPRKPDVFISHAVDEGHVARHLRRQLQNASSNSLRIFLSSDPSSVSAGEQWFEQTRSAAVAADSMLLLLSPFSMRRPWLALETGLRLAKGIGAARVFPVRCLGISEGEIQEPWRQMQTLDLTGAQDYERFQQIFSHKAPCVFATHDAFKIAFSQAEQVAAAELILNRIAGRGANHEEARAIREAAFQGKEVKCLELPVAEAANLLRIKRYVQIRQVVSDWSLTPSSASSFTLSFRLGSALCALARSELMEMV